MSFRRKRVMIDDDGIEIDIERTLNSKNSKSKRRRRRRIRRKRRLINEGKNFLEKK